MEIWPKVMEKSWKSIGQNVYEPCMTLPGLSGPEGRQAICLQGRGTALWRGGGKCASLTHVYENYPKQSYTLATVAN